MSTQSRVSSMTGYASAEAAGPGGRLSVELRSVNARFLDLALRVPDELRAAEPRLRELLQARLARGKVECRVQWHRDDGAGARLALDEALLARVADAAQRVHAVVPQAAPIGIADLLRWPGVIADAGQDGAAAADAAVELARGALEEFVASRQREGAHLAGLLREAGAGILRITAMLRAEAPALLAAHGEKLVERLRAALGAAAEGTAVPLEETMARVRQEVTAHGMRTDVAEEIGRLEAHVGEMRRTLAAGGSIGKRLDFLAQELNREANTIGSKASAVDLSNAAIDLKLLIEQIREQVQNIE